MMKKKPRARPEGYAAPITKSRPRPVAAPLSDDDDDDDFIKPKAAVSAGKKKPSKPSLNLVEPKVKTKGKAKAKQDDDDDDSGVPDLDWTPTPLLTSPESKRLVAGSTGQARMIKALADAGKARFGPGVLFSGEETHQLVVAIPLPSVALEWVLGVSGFPLGLFIQIVAETGVGKSGLLAEIARWFFLCGGGFWLNEAETKFNPHWYMSILREYFDLVNLLRAKSQEDWQRNLTKGVKLTKEMAEPKGKGAKGFGRSVPFLFGVDSLTGKSSETQQEKILGEIGADGKRGSTGTGAGIGGYGGMQAAGKMTDYIRSISQEFDMWPFSLVVIGQLKMSTDDMGNPQRKIAGGAQVKFQQALEFQLSKIGGPKRKILTRNFAGHELYLETFKNSWGEGSKQLATRVLWRFDDPKEVEGDPDDLYPRANQKTIWDWNWSLIWLLDRIFKGGLNPMLRSRLKDLGIHVESTCKGDDKNMAYSETLGMTKDDAVSWSKLGGMLQANPEIVKKLRRGLCIEKVALLSEAYDAQIRKILKATK